ncbi:pentatricopeptide repeat-containing protein [Tanacetum coccineum]|uniref:Pentatricopeptide repeat-containing protein n=1 Tax=Tanacetum coccineum TaxID=301880 RepID=A0ABQ5E4Y9_9ASTR
MNAGGRRGGGGSRRGEVKRQVWGREVGSWGVVTGDMEAGSAGGCGWLFRSKRINRGEVIEKKIGSKDVLYGLCLAEEVEEAAIEGKEKRDRIEGLEELVKMRELKGGEEYVVDVGCMSSCDSGEWNAKLTIALANGVFLGSLYRRCYGKMMVTESSFQVISLNEERTCVRNFKYGNLVNYKWIAKYFGHKIRQNSEIKLHEIADLVLKKYKCIVSPCQCRYAKTKALNEGDLTIQEHCALIRLFIVGCVCGKKGFQLGCRPVIALDGCFLKKPHVGEILIAVGRDGNNHIYPIAWAVVNVENKDNWSWFLELLGEYIDMPTRNGLTLILDQHKGLIEVVKDVMPLAKHRQCVRHIYEGFRKQYSGVEFRELFWAASKASYPQLFNKIMKKIKKVNPGAHDYLIKKDPKTWSRAFFRIGSNCEAVENGFSECFNSVLLLVRNKPLITMLESMRVIVMERLNTMRQIFEKWTGDICPNIQKRLELNKDKHRCDGATRANVGLGVRKVTSDGSPVARSRSTSSARGRGRGKERGRGGQTLGAGIQQTPEDGRNAEGNQYIRPRSARIMEKRLSRSNDVTGSSKTNDQS